MNIVRATTHSSILHPNSMSLATGAAIINNSQIYTLDSSFYNQPCRISSVFQTIAIVLPSPAATYVCACHQSIRAPAVSLVAARACAWILGEFVYIDAHTRTHLHDCHGRSLARERPVTSMDDNH